MYFGIIEIIIEYNKIDTIVFCRILNDSTVRGDGGSRVGEVRAGTTSPMPEHKGFKLQ